MEQDELDDLSGIQLAKLHYEAMQNAAFKVLKPNRNAMGEYLVPPGGKPLTSLGDCSPAPSDYSPKVDLSMPAAPQYSITGKAKTSTLNNYAASPADNDTSREFVWKSKSLRMKEKGRMRVYNVRDKAHINDSIGPARYNIENRKVGTYGPQWSVLSRQKEGQNAGPPNALVHPCDTDGFKTPGPNYRPNSGYWGRGPKKSFGSGHRHSPNYNPGPADYTIKEDPSAISYSLAKRLPPPIAQQQANKTDSPGPGAYGLDTQIGKAIAKSVSGRPDELTKDNFPAPNSYTLRDPMRDVVAPKLKCRPFEHSEVPHPSPTSYTIQNTNLKKAPVYSVRQITKPSFPDVLHYPLVSQKPHPVPGPGSYESKQGMTIHNDNPKYSMGKRANHIKNDVPGPNHYRIHVLCRPDAKTAPAFSMGSRRDVLDKRVSPGPAAYNLQQASGGGGYSMAGRIKHRNAFETPAPNAYGLKESLTCKGAAQGQSATLKSRASPYVFSGFRTTKVID